MTRIPPPSGQSEATTPPPPRGASVRVCGLVKDYGRVRAVDGVDLDVRRGEFLALLGPSGSGKTTILMTIAGFETPSAGRIIVDDRDVTDVRPKKRRIGMVFQSYALFPHMTVVDNIAFPLRMQRHAARDDPASASTAALRHGAPRRATASRLPASSPAASSSGWRSPARSSIEPARPADGRAAGRARQEAPRAAAARDQAPPARARG